MSFDSRRDNPRSVRIIRSMPSRSREKILFPLMSPQKVDIHYVIQCPPPQKKKCRHTLCYSEPPPNPNKKVDICYATQKYMYQLVYPKNL